MSRRLKSNQSIRQPSASPRNARGVQSGRETTQVGHDSLQACPAVESQADSVSVSGYRVPDIENQEAGLRMAAEHMLSAARQLSESTSSLYRSGEYWCSRLEEQHTMAVNSMKEGVEEVIKRIQTIQATEGSDSAQEQLSVALTGVTTRVDDQSRVLAHIVGRLIAIAPDLERKAVDSKAATHNSKSALWWWSMIFGFVLIAIAMAASFTTRLFVFEPVVSDWIRTTNVRQIDLNTQNTDRSLAGVSMPAQGRVRGPWFKK